MMTEEEEKYHMVVDNQSNSCEGIVEEEEAVEVQDSSQDTHEEEKEHEEKKDNQLLGDKMINCLIGSDGSCSKADLIMGKTTAVRSTSVGCMIPLNGVDYDIPIVDDRIMEKTAVRSTSAGCAVPMMNEVSRNAESKEEAQYDIRIAEGKGIESIDSGCDSAYLNKEKDQHQTDPASDTGHRGSETNRLEQPADIHDNHPLLPGPESGSDLAGPLVGIVDIPPPLVGRQVAVQRISAPGAFAVIPGDTAIRRANASIANHPQITSDHGRNSEGTPNSQPQQQINLNPLQATLSPDQEGNAAATTSENEGGQVPNSDEEEVGGVILVEASPDVDGTKRYLPCGLRLSLSLVLLLLVAVVVLSLGLAGLFSTKSNESQDPVEDDAPMMDNVTTPAPSRPFEFWAYRLKWVKDQGYLGCSYRSLPGQMEKDDTKGEVIGSDAMVCQALAAAIWSPEELDSRLKWIYNPNHGLQKEEALRVFPDFDPVSSTSYPSRSLFFTTPTRFDPMRLAGDPFYLECAEEKDFKHIEECQEMRVCVVDGNPHHEFITTKINSRSVVPFNDPMQYLLGFATGQCNLMFTPENIVPNPLDIIRLFGYRGNYSFGTGIYERGAWSSFVGPDDPEWYDFVNVVTSAPVIAEQRNITKATAHLMPQTLVFGEEYKDMLRNVIATVGNLAEQWEASGLPRTEMNQLNNGTTGLVYSHPLKDLRGEQYYRHQGEFFGRVLDRGYLICGIRFGRPGFAMGTVHNATGMEVDLCRSVAAGMFVADADAVVLVSLKNHSDGYQKLANGEIDVFAGGIWNLDNDAKEPTTGMGFTFSQPYFYDYSQEEGNLCLVTMQRIRQTDLSLFVYWTLNALIYAEEQGITQFDFLKMPKSPVIFGEQFERWFGDSVLGVGNFGELYDRNVQHIIPRSGRNQLSLLTNPGPLHYPIPFPV